MHDYLELRATRGTKLIAKSKMWKNKSSLTAQNFPKFASVCALGKTIVQM